MKTLVEKPKPPKQLFIQSKTDAEKFEPVATAQGAHPIWVCGQCGTMHTHGFGGHTLTTEERAAQCCLLKKCDCGRAKEIQHYEKCRTCRDKEDSLREIERMKSAELVETHDGMIFVDGYGGYREGFFNDVDDLLEWIEGEDDSDNFPIPEFVFCCVQKHFKDEHISAGDIIENETQDYHEDYHQQLDEDGLQKLLNQWVSEQALSSWDVDYSKKVRISDAPEQRENA